ncbi:MAG: phosphonate transport system ATP-binding protein [Anaerosporomusa subterranea]|jgi:phosphonate transport system ATP-binding protein|nr:phosphonate transport system ATP-binding protein [Anaerosporomusa subterranea]
MKLVVANNVSKIYSNGQGLKSASFTISEGEFVGVVGQSGVGKTTLMRLLCGAIFPTGGGLTLFGIDMSAVTRGELRKLRGRIATVYQNHNVIPCLDVRRNVILGRLAGASWYETIRRMAMPARETGEIREILEKLNIDDKISERCQELSGGQQQRVAIARALYSQADIFLADEPIASVDPTTASLILANFQSLKLQGKTVIMNLHQLDHAIKYCDRILMLEQGSICFDGPPEKFVESAGYSRLASTGSKEGLPQ